MDEAWASVRSISADRKFSFSLSRKRKPQLTHIAGLLHGPERSAECGGEREPAGNGQVLIPEPRKRRRNRDVRVLRRRYAAAECHWLRKCVE